jgi:hypothetical protein
MTSRRTIGKREAGEQHERGKQAKNRKEGGRQTTAKREAGEQQESGRYANNRKEGGS